MDKHKDRIESMRLILRVMQLFGLWPWSLKSEEEWTFTGFVKRNYRFLLHLPITFTFIGLMWLEAKVLREYLIGKYSQLALAKKVSGKR